MRLPSYLTFIVASCVFTFGINGTEGAAPPPSTPTDCPYTSTIICPTTLPFRPIDGTCNTPNSPYVGKSETPYARIIGAMYMGSKTPRNVSFFGKPLPDPRKISLKLFSTISSNQITDFSAITPTFARFVEHDLYKTKLLDASHCCTPSQSSGVCDNIIISSNDIYFASYLRTCLPKGKSVNSPTLDCKKDIPQQINENTHTLDLSNIYGSTPAINIRVRKWKDGLLKVSATKNLLSAYALPECIISSPNLNNEHCFDSGDLRVNVDPLIMAMYTIWVRHHNAVATKLKDILTDDSDDSIFQTARKIVIAQYQHIVYNEFLTALDHTLKEENSMSGTTSHNATLKPIIFNTFSLVYTAIVDSMAPSNITIDGKEILLDRVYYRPAKLFETNGIKKMLEAMQTTMANPFKRYVVPALKNSYLQRALGSGTDKVALNLQQSRENGAPVYTIFYRLLNNIHIGGDLNEIEWSPELKELYPMELDMELLPGLFYEKMNLPGVNYGKTTKVLIDKQFKVLKEGDPYFYSHAGVFTPEQFTEIKKTTLAKILCDNGDLTHVLEKALIRDSVEGNAKKECSDLVGMDTCNWSTVGWSDWRNHGLYFGFYILTRKCNILPSSKCYCTGEPIQYKPYQSRALQNIVNVEAIKKINDIFYENFGPGGNPLNPNKSNFTVILKGLTL